MSAVLLDSIRSANLEFQEFMELLSPDNENGQDTEKAIRRSNRIHLRLKHVSKCLASVPKSSLDLFSGAPEFQRYRENLKILKGGIEALQASMLAQQARLNKTRSNMQAARAWARSVRASS